MYALIKSFPSFSIAKIAKRIITFNYSAQDAKLTAPPQCQVFFALAEFTLIVNQQTTA